MSLDIQVVLPKDIKKRLADKLIERNEDLILDYLEEIEIHKQAIDELVIKINKLSDKTYLTNDSKDVQGTEENK